MFLSKSTIKSVIFVNIAVGIFLLENMSHGQKVSTKYLLMALILKGVIVACSALNAIVLYIYIRESNKNRLTEEMAATLVDAYNILTNMVTVFLVVILAMGS